MKSVVEIHFQPRIKGKCTFRKTNFITTHGTSVCFAPSSWQILKKCGRNITLTAVEAKLLNDERTKCEPVDPATRPDMAKCFQY